VLDDRVRAVLARLEAEGDVPPAYPVAPATGRFLFTLVAPQNGCLVLEVGAGQAGAASRLMEAAGLGGVERDRDHAGIERIVWARAP